MGNTFFLLYMDTDITFILPTKNMFHLNGI